MNSDLFNEYEKLVRIEILGHEAHVPEKNTLLRCFQFLSLETISYGDFCWNGDCANCQVWCQYPGQSSADEKPVLSCRTEVREGMVISKVSGFIKLEGINYESPEKMAVKD